MSEASHPSKISRLFGSGWLTRRTLLVPGWKGWLLILVVFCSAVYGAVRGVHGFLSPNEPVISDILVVDAWVPNYGLKQGLDLVHESPDRLLLLTGGMVRGEVQAEPGDTYVRVAMARLKYLGGDLSQVRAVESPEVVRDRTYSSAVATREWLVKEGLNPKAINVMTMGVHARRSRLLFEMAFGPEVAVGIIPITNREYDPSHWWRTSEGVKEVLSEGAAYLYARFLFRVS